MACPGNLVSDNPCSNFELSDASANRHYVPNSCTLLLIIITIRT